MSACVSEYMYICVCGSICIWQLNKVGCFCGGFFATATAPVPVLSLFLFLLLSNVTCCNILMQSFLFVSVFFIVLLPARNILCPLSPSVHHNVSSTDHQIHLPRSLAGGGTGLLLHTGAVHAAVHRATSGAHIHLHTHRHRRLGQASTRRGRELAGPAHGTLQAQGKSIHQLSPF